MGTLEDRRRNHQAFANVWDPTFMMKLLKMYRAVYGINLAKVVRHNMRLHGWLDCQQLSAHPIFDSQVVAMASTIGIDCLGLVLVPFEQAKHGVPLTEVN